MDLEVSSLGRTAARLARQVEHALDALDLSLPQYRILTLLGEGSVVASALADRLAVSRPSVTAVVDGLVSRGFVLRLPDVEDRRRVHHALTEEGRRALAEADLTVDARLRRIAALCTEPGGPEEAYLGLERWRLALDALRESHAGTGSAPAAPVAPTKRTSATA